MFSLIKVTNLSGTKDLIKSEHNNQSKNDMILKIELLCNFIS